MPYSPPTLTAPFRALKRRDVSGKSATDTRKGDESDQDGEDAADLGRIVNLMQCVASGLPPFSFG